MKIYSKDSESALEEATIQLFQSLGWETIHAIDEVDGDTTLLGRKHQGEVVLKRYLRRILKKLNPELPNEAISTAIDIIIRNRSAMDIANANRDVYSLLKNGVKVSYKDAEGNQTIERVKVIDWNKPENNHFLLVSQFWVTGDIYRRRPNLVGFVNGLPMILIELKSSEKSVYSAYYDNLRDYKDCITPIFWYNAFMILSNGRKAKVGSTTAPWEHFADWKKINTEGEQGIISLDTVIKGTCEKARFMDILENFTFFIEASGGIKKIVAKNHQYLGVSNVMLAFKKIHDNRGKLGVFWHTQGSGKSASMVFFTQKVLRKIHGNWSFVIVTDRQELDDQIYKTFVNSGIITEEKTQARSSNHLRRLLREDHRYIFTLIHKFRTDNGVKHPVLSERNDIIVITDESHRTQYDILAQNMRDALPNASFIGFTGTPLIKKEEERTREVFGDYVSIYNFTQSIIDKATVPLYYEDRIPEVQLTNEDLNEDMEKLLDTAMLDETQEKKVEREFARQYHIITRDDRLEKVAEDLVSHFMGRGNMGKAMVITIDKATAIKMYDKVQKCWIKYLDNLKNQIHYLKNEALIDLKEKIEFMEETDMAVVVSQAQNEVDDMRKKGLDILPHRKRIVKEDLDTKFKDPDNPLRIVFLCAMWMTGFDVPCCSTIYLDKPMRNHTLMQTIARANRVFRDKTNGLIVDYVGVFRDLKKALAIYGAPIGGELEDFPIKNKKELKIALEKAIAEVLDFLDTQGINFYNILKEQSNFSRIRLKEDAVEAILENDDTKKEFLRLSNELTKIYKAILPDPVEEEYGKTVYLIRKLADRIREIVPVDISGVMSDVEDLLDKSIKGYKIEEPKQKLDKRIHDLSQLNIEKLREKFVQGRKRIQLEQLRGLIEKKLNDLIRVNRTRIDYLEKFKQMIDEYNAGARNVDELFNQLIEFTQNLKNEEKRYIREELENEEELAIFDILTRPEMKLTKKEKKDVKRIARQLLKTLKTEKSVLDWRKKQQAKAAIKLAIQDILYELPAVYSSDIYPNKCNLIYQYIYDIYESY